MLGAFHLVLTVLLFETSSSSHTLNLELTKLAILNDQEAQGSSCLLIMGLRLQVCGAKASFHMSTKDSYTDPKACMSSTLTIEPSLPPLASSF